MPASRFSSTQVGVACAVSRSSAPGLDEPISRAETLTEIFRLRGRADPDARTFSCTTKTTRCGRSHSANYTTAPAPWEWT